MKDQVADRIEVEWLGTRYKTILSPEETGGSMSIVDTTTPAHAGPPRHIHHDADETFVMLTGECLFWMAGKTRRAGPGESVFVPRGTEHTFRVTSDVASRHLVILTPGGFEGFFEAIAAGRYAIPQDMEQIAQIAARFHLEFTGPPIEE